MSVFNKLINSNGSSQSNRVSINNDNQNSEQRRSTGGFGSFVGGGSNNSSWNKPKPILLSQTVSNINNHLNLSILRDKQQRELLMALNSCFRGKPKVLVVDPHIKGFLNLFTDPATLKSQGVEKIYELKNGKFDSELNNIVYLIRPRVKYIYTISDHIKQHLIDFMKKEYAIIYVPKIDRICQKVLEELGVYGNISSFQSFPLDLVPLDNDVLTLDLSHSYKDLTIDNDKSALLQVANSVMKIQSYFGYIPNIKGKGQHSSQVYDLITRQRQEILGEDDPLVSMNDNLAAGGSSGALGEIENHDVRISTDIDCLVMLDRSVDLITPLCTPLNYEGLLNEYFHIKNNATQIEQSIINPNIGEGGNNLMSSQHLSLFPVHSEDKVFNDIRDINISACSVAFNSKFRALDTKKSLSGKESLTELKNIMRKISSTQHEEYSLKVHVGIAEKLSEITKSAYFVNRMDAEQSFLGSTDIAKAEHYLKECIIKKDSIFKILRLLSLYSLTCNGIQFNEYEDIKLKLTELYGIGTMITLHNLERAGLILVNDDASHYPSQTANTPDNTFHQLRELMRLINADVNVASPDDISYVFSGYAPISVRFLQMICFPTKPHPKTQEEILRLLPYGPYFDESPFGNVTPGSSTTLIYYIGGVTYAEISAIRFLGKLLNRRFLVLTTHIIHGDSFVENFIECYENT